MVKLNGESGDQERWAAGSLGDDANWIISKDGTIRLQTVGGKDEETATRTAAALNACQGIHTELLESLECGLIPANETADSYRARATEAERLLAWAIPLLTATFEQPIFIKAMEELNIVPGPEYEDARAFLDGAKPQENGK